jgi:hypothetical protein
MIIKHYHEVLPAAKPGVSSGRNPYYGTHRKRSKKQIDVGPSVIITFTGEIEQEFFIYDRFGKKKKF